jgi:hypothetical protein
MTNKKYAIAIGNFDTQYSLVITSWEIDEETGERINQTNKNKIVATVEEALNYALNEVKE